MSLVEDGALAHADCGPDCEEPKCPVCSQPVSTRDIQTDQVGLVRVFRLHRWGGETCPGSNKIYDQERDK